MENTVTIKLDEFLNFYDEKKHLEKGHEALMQSTKKKDETIARMKKLLLEKYEDTYYITHYDIDRITDPESFSYGISNADKLLGVGITRKEMDTYIRARKEEIDKEEEHGED